MRLGRRMKQRAESRVLACIGEQSSRAGVQQTLLCPARAGVAPCDGACSFSLASAPRGRGTWREGMPDPPMIPTARARGSAGAARSRRTALKDARRTHASERACTVEGLKSGPAPPPIHERRLSSLEMRGRQGCEGEGGERGRGREEEEEKRKRRGREECHDGSIERGGVGRKSMYSVVRSYGVVLD